MIQLLGFFWNCYRAAEAALIGWNVKARKMSFMLSAGGTVPYDQYVRNMAALGGTLGSLLVIAVVLLGVISYKYYKMKHTPGEDNSKVRGHLPCFHLGAAHATPKSGLDTKKSSVWIYIKFYAGFHFALSQ